MGIYLKIKYETVYEFMYLKMWDPEWKQQQK